MPEEKYQILLESKLELSKYLTDREIQFFYKIIFEYLNNRISFETFSINLEELINLYKFIGLSTDSVISAITKYPSILHANKKDLLLKYLIMAKIISIETLDSERNNIFCNHPKDLMTSVSTLYSRIKFFLGPLSEEVTKNELITRRKVIKFTNEEFYETYGIAKDKLIKIYPFDENSISELLDWDENIEIKNKLLEEAGLKYV